MREPGTVTLPSTKRPASKAGPCGRNPMICPLLTHADMQKAMTELAEVFQPQIAWPGDDAAEIR